MVEFRDRLPQIWDETSASHARALEQLRRLCADAEGSGILALRKSARRLPTYVPARSVCGARSIGPSSGADGVVAAREDSRDRCATTTFNLDPHRPSPLTSCCPGRRRSSPGRIPVSGAAWQSASPMREPDVMVNYVVGEDTAAALVDEIRRSGAHGAAYKPMSPRRRRSPPCSRAA